MSLTIDSSRFGRVEIDPKTIVEFPDGLIGLGGSRYALLASDADSPFLWLHSLEDPELALPVTDPSQFFGDFGVELDDGKSGNEGQHHAGQSLDNGGRDSHQKVEAVRPSIIESVDLTQTLL